MTGDQSDLVDQADPGPDATDLDAADEAYASRNDDDETMSIVRSTMEWVVVIVGAIVMALVVRTFVAEAFSIPSGSMEDTLLVGDHVVVDKISYRVGEIDRFDIVVFDRPPNLTSPYDELIKRVIGLPGETISGSDGQVLIDGVPLDEPHLDDDVVIVDFEPVEIPDGQVFVMGDNRGRSSDSRVFGPIDTDSIVGQARVIYWPADRIGGF